ncbi:hypothetical protein C8R44DRAFT_728850 [Mycena epipterygia]|nr:hypothetical protein C8R44DRAFT_728850 [Mycena epipterygia]
MVHFNIGGIDSEREMLMDIHIPIPNPSSTLQKLTLDAKVNAPDFQVIGARQREALSAPRRGQSLPLSCQVREPSNYQTHAFHAPGFQVHPDVVSVLPRTRRAGRRFKERVELVFTAHLDGLGGGEDVGGEGDVLQERGVHQPRMRVDECDAEVPRGVVLVPDQRTSTPGSRPF